MKRAVSCIAFGLVLALTGCGATTQQLRDPLAAAREAAEGADDREIVGRAMLMELSAPSGSVARAGTLRGRLAELDAAETSEPPGIYASLPRAIDDELHGALESAAGFYLRVLQAARVDPAVEAPLFAAYAAYRLRSMLSFKPAFFAEHKKDVDALLNDPGLIGHRARTDILGLQADGASGGASENALAAAAGCVTHARFAGPFGEGTNSDMFRRFPAEDALPWPRAFPAPERGALATVADSKAVQCSLDLERVSPQQGT